eukprot:4119-Heterococcus_DN1.PRE.1
MATQGEVEVVGVTVVTDEAAAVAACHNETQAYNELLCAVLLLRSVGGLAVVTGAQLTCKLQTIA